MQTEQVVQHLELRAMSPFALLSLVVCAISIAGCATPVPLDKLTYAGSLASTTSKSARVQVFTSALDQTTTTTVVRAGGVLVAVTASPVEHLHFNARDQLAVGESLRAELVRLRLFRSASSALPSDSEDITVNIRFLETTYKLGWQYLLDVSMELSGGNMPLSTRYRVDSSERDSALDRMNTNGADGKAKAGKLLLEKLLPDIEAYIASSTTR